MKKLPIGIQSFSYLREEGYLYIDKTEKIHELLDSGKYYFLSRPRRFGKSLLLSTIKEIFQGNKSLFSGLWIEDKWNWEEKVPVVHIPFSSIGYRTSTLQAAIDEKLSLIAEEHGTELKASQFDQRFKELIRQLSAKGPIAMLIDEYDKPIIDYLTDMEQAKANREVLKSFYSVIKDSDPHIRFLIITGVSKFSRVSLFSDLNNLNDITISPKYATLLGYTQDELEHYFADRLATIHVDQLPKDTPLLEEIKKWYNGYSWDGKNFVYNPFSILSFFDSTSFQNFWFQTGTPTFLVNLLKKRGIYEVEEEIVGQAAFDSFDVERIDTNSLLFQTGYLTIREVVEIGLYRLAIPNQEVKSSLLQHLIGAFKEGDYSESTAIVVRLREAFRARDIEKVVQLINGLFTSIPHQIFLSKSEAYYHSLIHLVFTYLGLYIESEVSTHRGRADAIVKTATDIFVLEFKLDKSAEEAMAQIQSKGYAEKFATDGRPITAVAINFHSERKEVEQFMVQEI